MFELVVTIRLCSSVGVYVLTELCNCCIIKKNILDNSEILSVDGHLLIVLLIHLLYEIFSYWLVIKRQHLLTSFTPVMSTVYVHHTSLTISDVSSVCVCVFVCVKWS